jgi:hypothetical protein
MALPLEEDIPWKRTSPGRGHPLEEDIPWKRTSPGRGHSPEEDMDVGAHAQIDIGEASSERSEIRESREQISLPQIDMDENMSKNNIDSNRNKGKEESKSKISNSRESDSVTDTGCVRDHRASATCS